MSTPAKAKPAPVSNAVATAISIHSRSIQNAERFAARIANAVVREQLPTRVLLPALHAQADSVDFAATALPGFRGPRHLCGSLIEVSYPIGPRLGCPMNITAFGNDDRLDVGIAIDSVAIKQPDRLVECLEEAFDSYAATAAIPTPARSG